MGERKVDDDGYVWEKSSWTGEWQPVANWLGEQDRTSDAAWFPRPENERREDVDKGCFLTTACVKHRGLGNDCEELTIMRRLRDHVVRDIPEGESVVREYYARAPEIVSIEQHPNNAEIYAAIHAEIDTAVDLMKQAKREEAYKHCRKTYLRLKHRFLGLQGDPR